MFIATGKSARSAAIENQRELSFEQLAAALRGMRPAPARLTFRQYQTLKKGDQRAKDAAAAEKDGPWFVAAKFTEMRRAARNVESVSAIVLDLDSGNVQGGAIAARLDGIKYIAYTTFSSCAAELKWRVIVPYSRGASVDEHAAVFAAMRERFPEIDESTKDSCRLWFWPLKCCKDGVDDYCLIIQTGGAELDPASLQPPEPAEDDLPTRRNNADVADNDDLVVTPTREITADQVRRMLGFVKVPDEAGVRRAQWLKILCSLHDWSGGSEDGFTLADEWSSAQPAYVSSEDVRRTWESLHGDGITIGTLVQAALDAGFTFEDEEVPADAQEDAETASLGSIMAALDGGAGALKARIDEMVDAGSKKNLAALEVLQADLVYVVDQQEYFSLSKRALLSKDAIKQIYRSSMPKANTGKLMDPCNLLENSGKKKVVHSLGYHPGQADIYLEHERWLANWHKPYDPEPLLPARRELELLQYLLNHLFPLPKSREFLKYILTFLAFTVQKPGEKIASAPILYSQETGTGKTTMMFEIPRLLYGPLNSTTVSNDEVESGFSDFLTNKHLIHLDEIFMGGMRKAEAASNKFKPVVTNHTMRVHPKGFAGYDTINRVIVTACSNYEEALSLSAYDRRWAVHEITRGKLDKGFAQELYAWLRGPRGAGTLRYMLLRMPIAGFNPNADAPMTSAKKAMIDVSMTDEETLIKETFEVGMAPFHRDIFQLDELGTALEQRTHRLYTAKKLQKMLAKAVPEARPLALLKFGKGHMRVWCCRDYAKWSAAGAEEVACELGMTQEAAAKTRAA